MAVYDDVTRMLCLVSLVACIDIWSALWPTVGSFPQMQLLRVPILSSSAPNGPYPWSSYRTSHPTSLSLLQSKEVGMPVCRSVVGPVAMTILSFWLREFWLRILWLTEFQVERFSGLLNLAIFCDILFCKLNQQNNLSCKYYVIIKTQSRQHQFRHSLRHHRSLICSLGPFVLYGSSKQETI